MRSEEVQGKNIYQLLNSSLRMTWSSLLRIPIELTEHKNKNFINFGEKKNYWKITQNTGSSLYSNSYFLWPSFSAIKYIVQIVKIQLFLLEQTDRVNKENIVELEVNIYSRWTSLTTVRSWFKMMGLYAVLTGPWHSIPCTLDFTSSYELLLEHE